MIQGQSSTRDPNGFISESRGKILTKFDAPETGQQVNYVTFPHNTSPLSNRSPQSFVIVFGWFLEQLHKTFDRDPLWPPPPTLDYCIGAEKSRGKARWKWTQLPHGTSLYISKTPRTPNKYIIRWFAQSKIADVARRDTSKIWLTYVEDEEVVGTASYVPGHVGIVDIVIIVFFAAIWWRQPSSMLMGGDGLTN